MAATSSVWQLLWEWLLHRHRKRQDLIADDLVRELVQAWRYVKFDDLDSSQVPFVERAVERVRDAFEESQEATFDLLVDLDDIASLAEGLDVSPRTVFRTAREATSFDVQSAEDIRRRAGSDKFDALRARIAAGEFDASGDGEVRVFEAEPLDQLRVARALAASGPGGVKRALPAPEDSAMASGARQAAGVAVRMALDGGRGVAGRGSELTQKPIGFQRVTEDNPCPFCALLASLGPFFPRSGSFRKSNAKFAANAIFGTSNPEPSTIAKVHDNCRCTLVPAFEGFEYVDPYGKVALDLWNRVTESGLSGKSAMRVYRSAFLRHMNESDNPIDGDGVDDAVLADAIDRFVGDKKADSYDVAFLLSKRRHLRSVA